MTFSAHSMRAFAEEGFIRKVRRSCVALQMEPAAADGAYRQDEPICEGGAARDVRAVANPLATESRSRAVYLDYAGAGVCTKRQMREAFKAMTEHQLANPRAWPRVGGSVPCLTVVADSSHGASLRTSAIVGGVRRNLLESFGADAAEYDLVFVRSATEGLRLLAHSFPWGEDAAFVYETHCHTSLLGMRGCALLRCAPPPGH